MQIEEHFKLLKLFDTYGKLLSEKQQNVMDKFLNLDIGESEIAEMFGETRQSVHDALAKAKKQLVLFEEKCGVLQTQSSLENQLNIVKKLLLNQETSKSIDKIDEIIKQLN